MSLLSIAWSAYMKCIRIATGMFTSVAAHNVKVTWVLCPLKTDQFVAHQYTYSNFVHL